MNTTSSTMVRRCAAWLRVIAVVLLISACAGPHADSHYAALPSWNDGPSRQAIVDFVQAVTDPASPDFVVSEQRIAVFDNDGTLWSEQPMYFQMLFALDRLKAMALEHPEWKQRQPFKAAIEGDQARLATFGQADLLKIVGVTHTNMTVDDFTKSASDWAANAHHPRFNRRYVEMTYAPMRELLSYLRDQDFKTYIVSGGEVEFMRAWAPAAYGIPPEQIIGTTFVTTFEDRNGAPVLWRQEKLEFVDDGPGKPAAIQRYIGQRPILAFGNSDGDQQMLQWTAAGEGRRFAGLVHHTDAEREWSYDRDSRVGHLDKALDEAERQNWTVVDMKSEWQRVFSFESLQ